jgi:hypothetical protein
MKKTIVDPNSGTITSSGAWDQWINQSTKNNGSSYMSDTRRNNLKRKQVRDFLKKLPEIKKQQKEDEYYSNLVRPFL